ncbi:glycerol kinase [Lampropedia cohaerens]|uniref:Glycerol kinase n=1 Tax=Lampropedia cohaerens TaxID=1610491 RepID=A0A0U1Q028_9BURK|nr:glycerol kinase GlpK [Lampropedia cohaerens]KKW68112.1 glycerol kinase [Lampropedia cohaerens]
MNTYLLALDQGTSSSRSIVFDAKSRICAMAQQELPQIYPRPGWIEHDPLLIWRSQLATARQALKKAGISASQIRAVGITNQRETTVLWHRRTGKPLHHALVWQDRRAEPACAALRDTPAESLIQQKTGLRVDAYFSATKLQWLLDNIPGARAQAERGELAFGTVDSWLIWNLTRGAAHVTDVSNAARTMLFDVRRNAWDEELLALFCIPASVLPQVLPSAAQFGQVDAQWLGEALPITGVAGDQQAALFGQACFEGGMTKNTYGTGCFMLMHTGGDFQVSGNGLVTTSAAQPNEQPQFALEGSVFVAGAVVQWLRDGLNAISSSSEVQHLAETVPDSGGVQFVPAFTGLGAPYWQPDARGTITGITRGTSVAHIARAALESIAYQSAALLQAMRRDASAAGAVPVSQLRVDGGASVNDLLMQFQADLLGVPVLRPKIVETTAAGAAWLAGLGCGLYSGTDELTSLWQAGRQYLPTMPSQRAAELMQAWEHAVRQACAQ